MNEKQHKLLRARPAVYAPSPLRGQLVLFFSIICLGLGECECYGLLCTDLLQHDLLLATDDTTVVGDIKICQCPTVIVGVIWVSLGVQHVKTYRNN